MDASGGFQVVYITVMSIMVCCADILAGRMFIAFNKQNLSNLNEKMSSQENTMKQITAASDRVRDVFDNVMVSLRETNEQAEKNRNSMENVNDSMQSTANEIQNQALATTNIQQTIEAAEKRTLEVKDTSKEVLEIVAEGVSLSKEVNHQSELVNESTGKMSETIHTLLQRVNDVSSITESIVAISDQTNLLALNASIEAARAGEAGKGFAVVAEQIRVLSEDTRNSITQITEIITELTDASRGTMKTLEEAVKCIQTQGEIVEDVSQHFVSTGESMNRLNELLDEIGNDVRLLYDSNRVIVEGAEQLSGTTEEVTAVAQEGVDISNEIIDRMKDFNDRMHEISGIIGELSQTGV